MSLKFGPGLIGMLNVRANSAAELDSLLGDTLELVVPNLGAICDEMAALGNVQAAFPATQVVSSQSQAPAQPQGRTCPHGQMTYRTGNVGTPDAWAGYFCPLGKGDPNKCRPQYVGK